MSFWAAQRSVNRTSIAAAFVSNKVTNSRCVFRNTGSMRFTYFFSLSVPLLLSTCTQKSIVGARSFQAHSGRQQGFECSSPRYRQSPGRADLASDLHELRFFRRWHRIAVCSRPRNQAACSDATGSCLSGAPGPSHLIGQETARTIALLRQDDDGM